VLDRLDPCGYEDQPELSTTDNVSIITSTVNCGATTGYVTALYYRRTGEKIDRDQAFFLIEGKDAADVRWIRPATLNETESLHVTHSKGRIFRQVTVWNATPIAYSQR
jgi:hypothetical protein